jgi:hypothetical protein
MAAKKKKSPSRPVRDFPSEEFDESLLLDDDDWRVLEPAFTGPDGEQIADGLAEIFARLSEAIERGDHDRAAYTCRDGVRYCYLRSKTHLRALEYYYLSFVEGGPDIGEPLELIETAIARLEERR